MYIFTGLLRGIRIVTTHSSLHTRSYPLDYIGFAGSGIRELVHSYVGKYVVCNMRATLGAYFFLRFYSTLHPPLYSSRCFLRWKFFALKEGFYTKKKKNYEGTIFSLSTIMKNRCKRCRGDRLKAILCNFFCIENSSADRYHSRWCFSVYSTCFVSFVL